MTEWSGGATDGALAGLRVVELGESVAAAVCGRWLAAFGARVTKVEPPGGYPSRWLTALGEVDDATAPAAWFEYWNTGKESVVFDPTADRDDLVRLLAAADLVVRWLPSPQDDAAVAAARVANPALIDLRLSGFGAEGPYADYASSPLVLLALGGWQFVTGDPDREPLGLPGHNAEYLQGLFGVTASLAGVLQARASGRGATVELDAMATMASLHQFTVSHYVDQGVIRQRSGGMSRGNPLSKVLPCRDGYVGMCCTTDDHWRYLTLQLGRPDLFEDERFASFALRGRNAAALEAIMRDLLSEVDRMSFFREAQDVYRLPIGPCYNLGEVMADPQSRSRGFWTRPAEAPGDLTYPGLPVVMSATPWSLRRAPRLDEQRTTVLARQETARRPPSTGAAAGPEHQPLAGVRVLDFTRIWSGPLTCRILADLGAEVIRIDSPAQRVAVEANVQTGVAARGGYGTAKHNRNKLGLSINLNDERGRDLVRQLVARSDLLVENFSSRVMPNFGLGYEALRQVNPGLVMLVMPGFGSSGPYRDYSAYGPSIEPMIGLASLTGYADGPPSSTGLAYPDCVAGVTGAAAAMTALVHQRATGEGQLIDLSQVESTISLLGEYFLAYQATGIQPPRIGNRHPAWAPQGTYRCQGEDDWLSISVQTDDQWRALREVVASSALDRPKLDVAPGRRANADLIDREIAAWTVERDKLAAMAALQAVGVAAGAVLNAKELVENKHLNARGFFVGAQTLEGPSMLMPGTPVRVAGRTRDDWTAAPLPGEHNRQVLHDLLGLAAAEIDRLESDGVLGTYSPPREL